MMDHRIEKIVERKLVGKHIDMSFLNNKTGELWRSFMPLRKEIPSVVSQLLYSLQVYPRDYFSPFIPETRFEKWAALEVADFENVPAQLDTMIIPGGDYVVFYYRGSSAHGGGAHNYIFNEWFPASGFVVDDRPHFELVGDKYKNNDAASEEEIWIPIKAR